MPAIVDTQGGDLRQLPGRDYLDLGTCVNRYGPPPSVRAALRDVDPENLLAHPYGREEIFIEAYARFMGAAPARLIPGRGITEFIRSLAYLLPRDQVAVITPDYTDTIRWFPVHLDPPPGVRESVESRLERLDQGMRDYPYVILSNPNNPLGLYLHRDDLVEVCLRHQDSVLIVDEAYIEFLPRHTELSMVSSGLSNVVVLRSPNKFFGIAGTRTAAMWTAHEEIGAKLAERKLNWPLSYVDSVLATAALTDVEWAEWTRETLRHNAAELEDLLGRRFPGVVGDVPVHYRYVAARDPLGGHRFFLDHGLVVRAFDGNQPGRVSGLRITAPTMAEMVTLKEALT